MHEYTCAVVFVLILCFFLALRIFWEEQLAEQFLYFNFFFILSRFLGRTVKKAPCMFRSPHTYIKNKVKVTKALVPVTCGQEVKTYYLG